MKLGSCFTRACKWPPVHGLTDLFGIAAGIALDHQRDDRFPVRVTRWQPAHSRDAKLSCVFDSNPRGSPQPRILIIPPTMVDLPNPSVPAGVASWPRSHYASGAKLVSVCSGAFILAETGLVAGRSVSTHRVCAEALAKRFPEIYVDTKQRIIDDGDRSGSRYRKPHSMPRGDKPCPTAYRPC
jgi:transcriptional regulator GlxA family with amidase domain